MMLMRDALIWPVVVAVLSVQGTAAQEAAPDSVESLVQRRARLFARLDEMSQTGGKTDPVMKGFLERTRSVTGELITALGSDASLCEVERLAEIQKLLPETMRAYAQIEQLRARILLDRVGRRIRGLGGEGNHEVTEAKLQEAERLLQCMGPEQPFFDKAREQWQALQAALGVDDSGEQQTTTDINLSKARGRLQAAQEAAAICLLIATAEHLRFIPGEPAYDALLKEAGVNEEITALQRAFVEKESADMQKIRTVAAQLEKIATRATALEQSKADATESSTDSHPDGK